MIATGNLVIQPGDSLSIEPGVRVFFDGAYRLDVFGALFAVGEDQNRIIFSKEGDTYWMSINFSDDADDNSRLEYCDIEYASGSGYEPYLGAVNCNGSSPSIKYNNISNCSNNYGPYQHPEKMLPLFITNLLEDKKDVGRLVNSFLMLLVSSAKHTKSTVIVGVLSKTNKENKWVLSNTGRHVIDNDNFTKTQLISSENKILVKTLNSDNSANSQLIL